MSARCLIRLGVAIWYQSPDLRLARARNREHIDVFHDNNVRRPRLVHSRCTHASPSLKAVSDGWSRLITPGICDWRNRIQGSVCAAAILAAHVRFGSKSRHHALKSPCPPPKSGHCWPTVECPLCAKSRHMQCSNHVESAFVTELQVEFLAAASFRKLVTAWFEFRSSPLPFLAQSERLSRQAFASRRSMNSKPSVNES